MALFLLLVAGTTGCVLHGTDSGVCDFKLDPNYRDLSRGWGDKETRQYRRYHIPVCRQYVKYPACVPEMEEVNASAPMEERWLPAQRIEPDDEHPFGRFFNFTMRNKDSWVHSSTQRVINQRLKYEQSVGLERKGKNEYGEGQCDGDDAQRCKKYSACKGTSKSGCYGFPIQPRFTRNQDCQRAFEAYMCYINFPRCYYDAKANEYKSTRLCTSACKNFFKACNYHKSLWRCGKSEYFNGKSPENIRDYGRYTRDFFPGQPFKNGHKDRHFDNIGGRCTPAIKDSSTTHSPSIFVLVLLMVVSLSELA